MLNAVVELFLTEYFLIKAVLGKYLENSHTLFCALSKIFFISDKDIDALYNLAENDVAKQITTEKDFMQHQRMQKYYQLVGSPAHVNPEWEEVANIKGNAILMAQSCNLLPDADVSRNMLYSGLCMAATKGAVVALRILGLLQCEGIFLVKNEKAGLKKLNKVSKWNDSVSTLALLRYSERDREYNIARLRREVEDAPYAALYQIAVERYGISGNADVEEVKLLESSFNAGSLKRNTYDSNYARILYSKAISLKDKEKAVFTPNKELLSAIGDLPLKLSGAKMVPVDICALQTTAINRETERTAISRALLNADLRELSEYRPLCLCCDSKYVLNMYAQALLTNNADTHIEVIDISALSEYDFEPTLNNIFVRSIDEDKDNRFLLFFYGSISPGKMEAVKSLLQSGIRAKFHLNHPSVTLNLSAVLPICFCDRHNERLLKPYCDTIQLASITSDEMSVAIKDILVSKQKLYDVGTISFEEDISQVVGDCDIDTAEKLIDAAVRARRVRGAEITLPKDILQSYVTENNRPRIGFGGESYGKY